MQSLQSLWQALTESSELKKDRSDIFMMKDKSCFLYIFIQILNEI